MNTRDRILDAAAHTMRTRGLARTTTKEIAREAGYSEATLYKHFRDKVDLFVAVLSERVPNNLGAVLADLRHRVGQGTVQENLERVASVALGFYGDTFPIAASLFSDPALLAAHRQALSERGTGPDKVGAALTEYLAAEQAAGRLNATVNPSAAASLLLGACFQQAFLAHFADPNSKADAPDTVAASLVRALAEGICCFP